MITLGDLKLSCHKCISGHRTSYCDHVEEQILYELKPKGRPKKNQNLQLTEYRIHGKTIYTYNIPKECCNFVVEALEKPSQCKKCESCCGKKCCSEGVQCKNCVGRCDCGCGATDQECGNCAVDLCPKYWVS